MTLAQIVESIQANRKEKGFTQSQLARKAKISLKMLQLVEQGKANPSFFVLDAIANALQLQFILINK
jgi:transcriptional regulator with XRE-family HTH domain